MYLNLNHLEFALTWQCSGYCRHCLSIEPHPGAPAHIDPRVATQAIRDATSRFPIRSILTTGGEPMLWPDTVCQIQRTAFECGVPRRQLMTNGYFDRDNTHIRDTAHQLSAAGVNQVFLSVDAFHQDTIPVGPVHTFAAALLGAGIRRVQFHPAWVVNAEDDNEWNEATRDVLKRFEGLPIPVGKGTSIVPSGKNIRKFERYYSKKPLVLGLLCGSLPHTSPLNDVDFVTIEPDGTVRVCAFVIGNLMERGFGQIADHYLPWEHPIQAAILEKGLPGLVELAQTYGVSVDPEPFYSTCDYCKELVAKLKDIL